MDPNNLTMFQRTGAHRTLVMLLKGELENQIRKIDTYTGPQLIHEIQQRIGADTEWWVNDQAHLYERELQEEVNAYHDEPGDGDVCDQKQSDESIAEEATESHDPTALTADEREYLTELVWNNWYENDVFHGIGLDVMEGSDPPVPFEKMTDEELLEAADLEDESETLTEESE